MKRQEVSKWVHWNLQIQERRGTCFLPKGQVRECFIENDEIIFVSSRGTFRFLAHKNPRDEHSTHFTDGKGMEVVLLPPSAV